MVRCRIWDCMGSFKWWNRLLSSVVNFFLLYLQNFLRFNCWSPTNVYFRLVIATYKIELNSYSIICIVTLYFLIGVIFTVFYLIFMWMLSEINGEIGNFTSGMWNREIFRLIPDSHSPKILNLNFFHRIFNYHQPRNCMQLVSYN